MNITIKTADGFERKPLIGKKEWVEFLQSCAPQKQVYYLDALLSILKNKGFDLKTLPYVDSDNHCYPSLGENGLIPSKVIVSDGRLIYSRLTNLINKGASSNQIIDVINASWYDPEFENP